MFDKSNFKINTFDILPVVKEFFKQPTGERNITNIDEIRRYLSDIKPFSRLRPELQNKILQEAWYECYVEGRRMARQGERPACFYIILSGTAVVTYGRMTDNHIETVDILERGCTFGEKGIMTDSRQIFTVTSKTRVELLVLWKDDFKAIYMAEDRHCSKDDLKFLKHNVPFLRGFQIDRLNEFPHAIQQCNYRQSEVIAQDSRLMKHILVVRKGSMEIWKRLDPSGFVPKLNKTELDRIKNEKMFDDTDGEVHEATANNEALFSEIQLSGDVDTQASNGSILDTDFQLSRVRRARNSQGKRSSEDVRADSIVTIEKKFPGIADKRERLPLIDYEQLAITPTLNYQNLPVKSPPKERSRSITSPEIKFMFPREIVYIRVKTLNEGQHVGLADMLFPNQPALTLISNKCECLLLLKSSFVRIATDLYKQNIRRSEIPFPSDSDFYTSYHRNEVWKRYSTNVYRYVCEKASQQHKQPIKRPSSLHKNKKITLDLISPV